jgi:hypothetical protein
MYEDIITENINPTANYGVIPVTTYDFYHGTGNWLPCLPLAHKTTNYHKHILWSYPAWKPSSGRDAATATTIDELWDLPVTRGGFMIGEDRRWCIAMQIANKTPLNEHPLPTYANLTSQIKMHIYYRWVRGYPDFGNGRMYLVGPTDPKDWYKVELYPSLGGENAVDLGYPSTRYSFWYPNPLRDDRQYKVVADTAWTLDAHNYSGFWTFWGAIEQSTPEKGTDITLLPEGNFVTIESSGLVWFPQIEIYSLTQEWEKAILPLHYQYNPVTYPEKLSYYTPDQWPTDSWKYYTDGGILRCENIKQDNLWYILTNDIINLAYHDESAGYSTIEKVRDSSLNEGFLQWNPMFRYHNLTFLDFFKPKYWRTKWVPIGEQLWDLFEGGTKEDDEAKYVWTISLQIALIHSRVLIFDQIFNIDYGWLKNLRVPFLYWLGWAVKIPGSQNWHYESGSGKLMTTYGELVMDIQDIALFGLGIWLIGKFSVKVAKWLYNRWKSRMTIRYTEGRFNELDLALSIVEGQLDDVLASQESQDPLSDLAEIVDNMRYDYNYMEYQEQLSEVLLLMVNMLQDANERTPTTYKRIQNILSDLDL